MADYPRLQCDGMIPPAWDDIHAMLLVKQLHDVRHEHNLNDKIEFLIALLSIRRKWMLFESDHALDKYKAFHMVCKLHEMGARFYGFLDFITDADVTYDADGNVCRFDRDNIPRLLEAFPNMLDYIVCGEAQYDELKDIFVTHWMKDLDWQHCYDVLKLKGI